MKSIRKFIFEWSGVLIFVGFITILVLLKKRGYTTYDDTHDITPYDQEKIDTIRYGDSMYIISTMVDTVYSVK